MSILRRKVHRKKNKKIAKSKQPDWELFDECYEENEYYGEEDAAEDEYYEEEDDTEDEYYEEEDAADDEEYDDEEYDDEEYDDEEYDDEEYDDEEYDDEEYDDEEYDDEVDEYEEEPKGIKKIGHFLMNMNLVDNVVMFTGAIVLLLVGFTGYMLVNTKMEERQIATFAEVGEGMDRIPVIGESGLVAISDAQKSKVYAAELEEIEKEATQRDESTGKIEVTMGLTSIQKDLKIKFANKKSGKLIPNIVFETEITKPSGETYILKDEDKDGIIYKKDMEPGKYKVAIVGPNDLKDYSFSRGALEITVKDTIEYKKVDVANEVKTEAQVNAAAEDTKVNETVVESTNADTVEWVESTKTLIEGAQEISENYVEVNRNDIADPSKKAAIGFRLLDETDPTQEPIKEPTQEPTQEPTKEPTQEPTKEPTQEPTKEPTQEPTALPTDIPTATPTKMPAETATIKPTATPTATGTATPVATATATPTATGTVTPVATATATPTATGTATPTVSPSATPNKAKDDYQTELKNKAGDVLYYYDEASGEYKVAKYAHYFKDIRLYRKIENKTGEYRYTGWQTIDGSTYFFDKNGIKVTGVQVIQGAKYTFNDNGVLDSGSGNLGIDVSKWNGNIDWKAVKNSGVSYVIIRCGYRGSATGVLVEDPKFRSNMNGALNAGLKVGVYFFSQATNEVEAVEEASMALGLIRGYNISFPVFLDVEATDGNDGRADGISVSARTAVCRAFCQTVQNSGYKAGIYANKSWLNGYIDSPSLTNYKIWLAQYAAAPSYTRTKYDMWQYSSKGRVAGISGNVDMNISYLGY